MIVLAETLRLVDAVDSWARFGDPETVHVRDAVDSWVASDDPETVHVRDAVDSWVGLDDMETLQVRDRLMVRLAVVLLLVAVSGCAPRYTLVRVDPVGPVQVETWHDRQRQSCERRVYLGSDYYWSVVPCPA